jgi:hypothetical protein
VSFQVLAVASMTCVLGCCAVESGRCLLIFRRGFMPYCQDKTRGSDKGGSKHH